MVTGGALYDAAVLYGDNTGNFTPGPVFEQPDGGDDRHANAGMVPGL